MNTLIIKQFMKVSILLTTVTIMGLSCKKEQNSEPTNDPGAIQGTPGNPRFNLQFTNGTKTDLDLYVQTPDGSVIYYGNPSGNNGILDVDCLCGACPNGPNENIYWTPGTAPTGNYKVWVEYFGDCDGSGQTSNYTLRIMNNSAIIQTYTGSLSLNSNKSPVYTFRY